MLVKHAGGWIVAHATGSVLVADAFTRNALLEISVERDRSGRMASLPKDINPTVLETVERLDVIWRVRELDSRVCSVGDGLRLIGATRIARGMSSNEARLPVFDPEWVLLCSVTRLSGSGRSSVVSHHGTA